MKKIVVVDDEEDIIEIFLYNFKKEGFQVYIVGNGIDGVNLCKNILLDLVLLDVMMFGMDGVEVCEILCSNFFILNILICFFIVCLEDYLQIVGFDVGVDDYIVKLIKMCVFISCVKVLFCCQEIIVLKEKVEIDLVIDCDKYIVYKSGQFVYFLKKEFELLVLLVLCFGIVFEWDIILEKVWGIDIVVGDCIIDVYVCKLWEKIGDEYIQMVKGIGYKFKFEN